MVNTGTKIEDNRTGQEQSHVTALCVKRRSHWLPVKEMQIKTADTTHTWYEFPVRERVQHEVFLPLGKASWFSTDHKIKTGSVVTQISTLRRDGIEMKLAICEQQYLPCGNNLDTE